jgi:hypothetical protein
VAEIKKLKDYALCFSVVNKEAIFAQTYAKNIFNHVLLSTLSYIQNLDRVTAKPLHLTSLALVFYSLNCEIYIDSSLKATLLQNIQAISARLLNSYLMSNQQTVKT